MRSSTDRDRDYESDVDWDAVPRPTYFQTWKDYRGAKVFLKTNLNDLEQRLKHLDTFRKRFYFFLWAVGLLSIICVISTAPKLICAAIKQDVQICLDNKKGAYILMGVSAGVLPLWTFCIAVALYSGVRRRALDGMTVKSREAGVGMWRGHSAALKEGEIHYSNWENKDNEFVTSLPPGHQRRNSQGYPPEASEQPLEVYTATAIPETLP